MNASNPAAVHYAVYWKAWFILLAITATMLFVQNAGVVMTGISAKALIIMLWFMHLRVERKDLVTIVIAGIFATSLVMYFLMAVDGKSI